MKINIAYPGIRFQRHGEESASSQATGRPRSRDNEHEISPYHFPVFVHRQKRPQAIVRGIGYVHAVSY